MCGKWLLCGAFCLTASVARADPGDPASCAHAVQLEGVPRLVVPLAQALLLRGITKEAPPGCAALSARLEERGARIGLTLIEARRRSERTVANLGTALTAIESFVRSDLSAPLLAAPTLAEQQPAVVPRPQPAPAPPPPSAAPRFRVGLMAEAAIDTAGSPWLGADLNACTRIGPLCLGMLFRFAAALPLSYKDGLTDQRFASDLYVTADLPLRLGRVTLSPGLGLGLGWQRHLVHGHPGSPPPAGTEADSDNDADDYFDEAVVNDGGMRAEVWLGLAYPLRAGLALEARLALAAAFLDSPSVVLAVAGKELAEPLMAAPWGMLRGGLGLRWSGP